jgi:23S rRNA (adenine2503-C2)-methyltransferase
VKNGEKIDLLDLTREELTELVLSLGEKPYHAGQVYSWIYGKGVLDIDKMTDLSVGFRESLKDGFSLACPLPVDTLKSVDATIKFVTELADGARIESVIIQEEERTTLCVSTQAGCALDCKFCLTGEGGAGRDLTLAEMTGQLFTATSLLKSNGKITNIVLMGMGEPLLNYDEVIKFVNVLVDQKGLSFAPRRVTLSTAGVVPGIKKLGRDSTINLAVSLNATTNDQRSRLMPINKKYPLSRLLKALREYPLKKSRHITIEYVLIGGVNDTAEDSERLAKLLKGINVKINLIPLNPHKGSKLKAPEPESVLAFKDSLIKSGYIAVIRESKGADILAACGQLSQK